MKIKRSQLKQIIKEEINRILNEQEGDTEHSDAFDDPVLGGPEEWVEEYPTEEWVEEGQWLVYPLEYGAGPEGPAYNEVGAEEWRYSLPECTGDLRYDDPICNNEGMW